MSAFSQAVNYTGQKPKASGRPQISRNQAFSSYSPSAQQGQAQPMYGAAQQQGGFPSVPQQGQRSAPDMSVYGGSSMYSPPPRMGSVAPAAPSAPVAVQDPSGVQRQIEDLKRRGTWDDPRNAKARERLEGKLRDINAAPPGYFVTPDGRLEPNYVYSLHGTPPQAAASPATPPPRTATRPAPPQPAPFPQSPQPAANYMPQQSFSMPPMNFGTRDAFIASINNSLAQQQANGFNTQGAAPPQFNFPALYRQASQMVANGWSNPLAALLG